MDGHKCRLMGFDTLRPSRLVAGPALQLAAGAAPYFPEAQQHALGSNASVLLQWICQPHLYLVRDTYYVSSA